MNAAERLWRAYGRDDWRAAEAQMHEHVEVLWPVSGERLDREEYLFRVREKLDGRRIDVLREIRDGKHIALEVIAGDGEAHRQRCGAFYDLHQGLIAVVVEYWTGEG
ncbi:MAG: nuclear transport factor 2 family protein [Solirubrobacterales bacterium]|nr:nuclear transport factor 2 family protein [Solirubrobacterales bacterium]